MVLDLVVVVVVGDAESSKLPLAACSHLKKERDTQVSIPSVGVVVVVVIVAVVGAAAVAVVFKRG